MLGDDMSCCYKRNLRHGNVLVEDHIYKYAVKEVLVTHIFFLLYRLICFCPYGQPASCGYTCSKSDIV
jgi:hypothetical protein